MLFRLLELTIIMRVHLNLTPPVRFSTLKNIPTIYNADILKDNNTTIAAATKENFKED